MGAPEESRGRDSRASIFSIPIILLAILLLLSGPTTTVRAAPGNGPEAGSASGIREIQRLGSLPSEADPDPDRLVEELVSSGPSVLPTLRSLSAGTEDPRQIEVLAAARARLRDESLSGWLVDVAAHANSEEARIEAFAALAAHGESQCLGALLESLPGNSPGVKRHADQALVAIISRSDTDQAYQLIREKFAGLADEERARVITSVARADSPRGLALLGGMVGRYPNVDLSILSGLAGMTAQPDGPEIVQNLRPLLASDNSNLRREAISALGNFHDADSVEEFVAQLGGAHAGVAGNAHWALRRLSGLNLPRDPVRWQMWLTAERTWWQEEGQALQAALQAKDEGQIERALHLLAMHPLYRERFAAIIEEYAGSLDAGIREAAEGALCRLGLREGAPTPMAGASRTGMALRAASPEEALAMLSLPAGEVKKPEPAKSSNLMMLVLGLPVCLFLLMRIGGLSPLWRLKDWLSREKQAPGPQTLRLKPRDQRRYEGR